MIGGITTYLIIYIQFYALYGKNGDNYVVRANTVDNNAVKEDGNPTKSDTVISKSVSRMLGENPNTRGAF